MSQLDPLLQQCTVKLSIPGRTGWGTGFFVAPGLILTCEHVVRQVQGQSVQVQWQNQENWAEAVVERSLRLSDVALLRVTLPADANPPCVMLGEEVKSRDPLYTFGYPDEGDCYGEPRTFNCIDLTGSGWILFNDEQVRPGMSGAPLLNQRTGKVCGMVKLTRDRSSNLGGGAVSSHVILEVIPKLEEQQRSFHQQDQRWSQCMEDEDSSVNGEERRLIIGDNVVGDKISGDKVAGNKMMVSGGQGMQVNAPQSPVIQVQGPTTLNLYSSIPEMMNASSSTEEASFAEGVSKEKVILMLVTDPNLELLSTRKEIKEIRAALKRSTNSGNYKVEDRPEIAAADLSQELSSIEPYIVHISGHEGGIERLVVQVEDSRLSSDNSDKFSKLIGNFFELYASSVHCIVLNRCSLSAQANEIIKYIKFIIAIDHTLDGKKAIRFLEEFYFQLGKGRSIRDAYSCGCSFLERNYFEELQNSPSQLPLLLDQEHEARKRELERELHLCNAEIENHENDVKLWKRKASILENLGRHEEASEAYEQASLLDKEDYRIRVAQGDVLEEAGKHQEAVNA